MERMLKREMSGTRRSSSSVSPLLLNASRASPSRQRPISPCSAFTGSRKLAGAPMLLNVPTSFWAIWALFPMPDRMSLFPWFMVSIKAEATAAKSESSCSLVFFRASASMSMQRRPLAIISSVSIFLVERRRLADFRLGKSGGDGLIVNAH